MEILGIIPARGGSKGIPRKNIRVLCGKPLIAYTIEAALESRLLKRFIVSTDDAEIAEVSRKLGAEVPFLRPPELATDTTPAIEVIHHAHSFMEQQDDIIYDGVAYLEPPAPLRESEDIDNAIQLYLDTRPDSVVSVILANQFHPILMKKIVDGRLLPFCIQEPIGMPRQSYDPPAYMRNGAVYVFSRRNILKKILYGDVVRPYIMPEERAVCIDDMNDWYIAEAWMKKKLGIDSVT